MRSPDKTVVDQLIEKALEAGRNAYAPYSNFRVGAALLTATGNLYSGCNVENASFGATNCAERTAIFNAVSAEGREMKIKLLLVLAENEDPVTPCGICRQVVMEFSHPKTLIGYGKVDQLVWANCRDILPDAFSFPP